LYSLPAQNQTTFLKKKEKRKKMTTYQNKPILIQIIAQLYGEVGVQTLYKAKNKLQSYRQVNLLQFSHKH
jgi:hypothetical protein